MVDPEQRPKAYSYVRFSSPEQMKGDSWRRQSERARAYALEHGLDLVEGSYEDLGISAYRGRNAIEGGLADFKDAVKDGHIEKGSYLLIENLDRLSRAAPIVAQGMLYTICLMGITVVTLTDRQTYTAENLQGDVGKLLVSLVSFIRAHDESRTKSDRGISNWEQKRKNAKDKPLTKIIPKWLRMNDAGQIEEVPERVKIVQDIYQQYLSGVGPKLIAKKLNEDKVPVWGWQKRTHDYWQPSYINKILDTTAVIGQYIPHKVKFVQVEVNSRNILRKKREPQDPIDGYFPAVIDQEMFDRVRQLRRSGKMPKTKMNLRYLFSGLAVCPACGGPMSRLSKNEERGWVYMVCNRAKSGAGCVKRAVNYGDAERAFLRWFRTALPSLPTNQPQIDPLRADLDFWKYKQRDYQTQLDNITSAIKSGDATEQTELMPYNAKAAEFFESVGLVFPKTLLEEMLNLEEVIADCKHKQLTLLEQIDNLKPEIVERKIKAVIESIDNNDDIASVNSALRGLCKRIVVDYDETMLKVSFHHTEAVLNISYKRDAVI